MCWPLPCPLPVRAAGQNHVNCNLRPAEALGEIPFPYSHPGGHAESSKIDGGMGGKLPSAPGLCHLSAELQFSFLAEAALGAHHPWMVISPHIPQPGNIPPAFRPAAGEGVEMPGDTWWKGCQSWARRVGVPCHR